MKPSKDASLSVEEAPATPNVTSSSSNPNGTRIAQANKPRYESLPEEDRSAPEQIDFAIALIKASRAELPLATLDTVVFLLRHVIDERQITPGHPLYISSMSNLASALGFRFIYANQLEDFVDTYSLRRKIIEACNEDKEISSVSVFTGTYIK